MVENGRHSYIKTLIDKNNNLIYPKTCAAAVSYNEQKTLKQVIDELNSGVPNGGTKDQILIKQSATNQDVAWQDINTILPADLFSDSYVKKSGDTMTGNLTVPSVYTSNWFRSTGSTGWYNESYGGGWYMTDSTYIRNYNSKTVRLDNLCLGADNNSYRLYVNGTSYLTGQAIFSGLTSNTNSIYQFDGATYRNPNNHTPEVIISSSNSTTGIDGYRPGLVLYNPQGNLNATVGLTFAFRETAAAGNSVMGAAILAVKESEGTSGAWSQGGLQFLTKNMGTKIEAMRITNAGNVGIGTTAPSYKLHVTGDIYANGGWLRTSGAAGWYNESYGGGWYMTDSTYIRNYNSKTVRLDNLCLGADNNSYRLYVNGTSLHTNTIAIEPNTVAIDFRNSDSWHTTFSYQTAGNEALVLGTKQSVTSFIIYNGEDSITNHNSDRWYSLINGIQIKQNCLAIGSGWANGVSPDYKLKVGGTGYFNGQVTATQFNGNLNGNASSATKVNSLRTINGNTHAQALQNEFNNYKSSIPRNCLINYYSSAYGNGSQYMGYFLSGYDSTPYGGFFVAHYTTPYYVGIAGGGFYQYQIWKSGDSVTGAVWNDYAEYREADTVEGGYCVYEIGDDKLEKTTKRLMRGCSITSDTWGFAQGETETAKTPIAVAGRVLVYTYEDREVYKNFIGHSVCSGPNGTVSIMTEEEELKYPWAVIGIISSVPEYDEWGGGENADRDPVKVDGRVWIKLK